jgi:predicted nucleotide-binding protein
VILLHRGSVDLPSDIAGIKYVDISEGIDKAEDNIRAEVAGWI